MLQFGIVGKSLSHSFSKSYFEKKFKEQGLNDYSYEQFEIPIIENFTGVLSNNPLLKGLNVTIPYKETIIPFLDELSVEAKEIGAVNCVDIRNGKLIGHNTDVYGFSQSIKPFLDTNHERALILGTGGAAKAAAYSLKKIGVDVYFVTSSSTKKTKNTFFYSEVNERVIHAFKLVINATPLGMFPGVLDYPSIPYQLFTAQHLAYDFIYNPEQTLFLKHAKEFDAVTVNGLSMLHLQAEKSWEIWMGP
jgi:shikimate dehydrogenase